MVEELKEQINVVVQARKTAQLAMVDRVLAYGLWQKEHQQLLDNEGATKASCNEAEAKLRELTLQAYTETGNKAPAVGVGIREVTKLTYEVKEAFEWANKHNIALKLDTPAFEKIVKVSPLDFVTVTQEPLATIATELNKVE